MITWKLLLKYNENDNLKIKLERTKETELEYENHKNQLKKNININDYLINLFFSNNEKYVFNENLFKYDLCESIIHYVFWINQILKMSLI